jgi:hypothetical protein
MWKRCGNATRAEQVAARSVDRSRAEHVQHLGEEVGFCRGFSIAVHSSSSNRSPEQEPGDGLSLKSGFKNIRITLES